MLTINFLSRVLIQVVSLNAGLAVMLLFCRMAAGLSDRSGKGAEDDNLSPDAV